MGHYMTKQNKKILITGAAGFIGFHLSLFLKKRNDTVIGYDNFFNNYNPLLKKQRCEVLKKHGIHIIKADILDFNKLQQVIIENEITHIVHLAAIPGVRHSFKKPIDYVNTNINGFINLLEAVKNINTKLPIVYASSSSVYNDKTNKSFESNKNTGFPLSIYGVSKKTNELLAYIYHKTYNISVTGLRFFSVFGPWGRPDMAYFLFTEKILKEEPIMVFNKGNTFRSYTYISDIIEGITSAIDNSFEHAIFNLGNDKTIFLMDLISTIENFFHKKAKITYSSQMLGELTKTHAEISCSKKKLNFSPKISFEKGMQYFLKWYLDYNNKIKRK